MQRDEGLLQRELVLGADRHGEAVDDGREDLEQLRDAVVPLLLVQELVEHVVDRLADGDAPVSQLPVDAMGHRLQALPLALVQRVEQVDQVLQERVVDQSLTQIVVDLLRQHQVDQQLVHQRNVRPLGVGKDLAVVVVVPAGVHHLQVSWREKSNRRDVGQRAEQVLGDHIQCVLKAFRVVEERARDEEACPIRTPCSPKRR